MKKIIYIFLLLIISHGLYGQIDINNNTVSFDHTLEYFKEIKGWNPLSGQINDTVTRASLFRTKDFNVSLSNHPIPFDTVHLVAYNPYYTDDFDDWDDNYINYPISYSVIIDKHLVSLFRTGKFVCIKLSDLKRDYDFEKILNTRKFKYHWIIDDKLAGLSGNRIYVWEDHSWQKLQSKFPLRKQAKLYEDDDFVVFCDCHGEWGGTVYFYEKSTEDIFFTESTCANSVIKREGNYIVTAHLGHGSGSSEIKLIEDPRKLTKTSKREVNKRKDGEALGYTDKSEAYKQLLELYGIQIFSSFMYEGRQLHIVNLFELTFIAEIIGSEIQIVHPLFDSEIYTHEPLTNTYGEYVLMNLDFYGTAKDREVSVIIINEGNIIKIDWNEKQSK